MVAVVRKTNFPIIKIEYWHDLVHFKDIGVFFSNQDSVRGYIELFE